MLDDGNHAQACFVAHSLGSTAVSWMLHDAAGKVGVGVGIAVGKGKGGGVVVAVAIVRMGVGVDVGVGM